MDGEGLRQGCPLSPALFNVTLADVEGEIGKVRWGVIILGGRRVLTLAYAELSDDGGRGGGFEEHDRETGGILR